MDVSVSERLEAAIRSALLTHLANLEGSERQDAIEAARTGIMTILASADISHDVKEAIRQRMELAASFDRQLRDVAGESA